MTIPEPFSAKLVAGTTTDLIAEQLAGMEAWLAALVGQTTAKRRSYWRSVSRDSWRVALRQLLGCHDLHYEVASRDSCIHTDQFTLESIDLRSGLGLPAGGLLAQPSLPGAPIVLALSPSDVSPKDWFGLTDRLPLAQQLARHIATAGYQVVCPRMAAPVAMDGRIVDYPGFGAPPNGRDEIWRLATQLGLTFAGLELQAALACLLALNDVDRYTVIGMGDSGRLGMLLAAVDTRAQTVYAQHAFGDRLDPRTAFPWPELIHGWALRFGDAELATLISPRPIVLVEPLQRLADVSFRQELDACEALGGKRPRCMVGEHAAEVSGQILAAMGITPSTGTRQVATVAGFAERSAQTARTYHEQKCACLRDLLEVSAQQRERRIAEDPAHRRAEWQSLVGTFPQPNAPLQPGGRLALPELQTEQVETYEVCVPVYREPRVFVRGLLALPRAISPGQRLPAVICSHGWEGTSEMTHQPGVYNAFALRLAERGYITWAPQSYFRSEYTIQALYRMASLIGKTEFGLMAQLHGRGIDYLCSLPFVDPNRIGFYGLSYGGYSALWLNGLEPRLAAVVCSGHFNDWQPKTTGRNSTSYIYTENASMYVAGILTRFNHGDLAALACPRPFLIEVGDEDWVVQRDWVEREFARAQSVYAMHGAADCLELAWGKGGHQVYGQRSFAFLDRWLK